MGIERHTAIWVLDFNQVAIAARIPTGIGDSAPGTRHNRGSGRCRNINPLVHPAPPHPKAAAEYALSRELERLRLGRLGVDAGNGDRNG